MIYREVLIARENLNHVNAIDSADPKFLYAVSRNKAHLDSVIKHLDSIKKASDTMNEFWQKLDEINKKYADRDESGTVQYTAVNVGGEVKKAYKKVIGEGNPDSAYTKEVDDLRKKYQGEIDKYDAGIKRYNEMLDIEVPDGDLRVFMIDFNIIPKGLNPRAMDGCLYFTREIEDGSAKKEESKPK